jgi:hypothetical protein
MPLQSLDLGGCKNLTDAGLVYLQGMPLQSLNLMGCRKLTDTGIASFKNNPKLDFLF